MPSPRSPVRAGRRGVVVLVAAAAVVVAQTPPPGSAAPAPAGPVAPDAELERAFTATAGQAGGAAGAAFRATPGAAALLAARIASARDDRALAIQHLERMPEASRDVAAELLALAAAPGELGLSAAIAVGNVAPWWPDARRANARQVLADRFQAAGPGRLLERVAMSRSWTRATLQATADVGAIERMLRSDDPFQIEFALHQTTCLGRDARALLPALCDLAAARTFPVRPDVRGQRRELPCAHDWTPLVRDQLYWALRRADAAEPAALGVYLERWPRTSVHERFELLRTIGCMGAAAAPALPQVTASSRTDPPLLAREAVTVIGLIGVPDPGAVERLRELDAGGDRQLAVRARDALRHLGAATAPR